LLLIAEASAVHCCKFEHLVHAVVYSDAVSVL
jgi:hypothetical protein